MFKRLKTITVLLLCLFSFFQTTYAKNDKTITLGATHAPPAVYDTPEYHGYLYEIVKAAFESQGYTISIKFMPWQEMLVLTEAGKIDGVVSLFYTRERAKYIAFSESFAAIPVGLFKRRDSGIEFPIAHPHRQRTKLFQLMQKYRFGIVKGYAHTPEFDNNNDLKKIEFRSDKENLEQLYLGQVDLSFMGKHLGNYLLTHQLPPHYKEELIFMEPALGYKKLYLGISKRHPNYQEVLKDFNQGLEAIREDGTVQKILDKDAESRQSIRAAPSFLSRLSLPYFGILM